ncbi:MAG: hypothetical protein AABZ47_04905, partial [Planctomycetota bacterium]
YQTRTVSVNVGTLPVDKLVLLLPNGIKLGDEDGDGDTDMYDYREFHACVTDVPIATPCRIFDFTADEQLGLNDYAQLANLINGPTP